MPDNQKNKKLHPKARRSAGQTLIETLAAAFILTMGISAAVGLAIYALNSSGEVVKQIIATGLAREGVEAVRNMRDTNWLQDTLGTQTNGNNCYVYNNTTNGSGCYPNWLGASNGKPFCLKPSNGGSCNGKDIFDNYYLGFDSTTQNFWLLSNPSSNFGLDFNDPSGGSTAWEKNGFYSQSGTSCANSSSGYCRTIIITNYSTTNGNAVVPYDKDANLSLLKVQSQVWWTDTKCPKAATFAAALVSCRIELDTYLTNWKNF